MNYTSTLVHYTPLLKSILGATPNPIYLQGRSTLKSVAKTLNIIQNGLIWVCRPLDKCTGGETDPKKRSLRRVPVPVPDFFVGRHHMSCWGSRCVPLALSTVVCIYICTHSSQCRGPRALGPGPRAPGPGFWPGAPGPRAPSPGPGPGAKGPGPGPGPEARAGGSGLGSGTRANRKFFIFEFQIRLEL